MAQPPVLGAVLRRDILVGKDGLLAHSHAEWLERLRKDALFYTETTGDTRPIRDILRDQAVNIKNWGAVGDGTTNDYPSIQAAIDYAVANGKSVYIPAASVKYLCNSALDCHDTDHLKIFGEGMIPPAAGLALTPPTGGSVLAFNTGATGGMIDAVGSDGLTLEDLTLSSLGESNPTNYGLIIGTSPTVRTGAYGGGAANLRNVAFYLPPAVASFPIYGNNHNNSVYINVWSIAGWGPVIVSGDAFGITPPYGTWGPDVQNDGLVMVGCTWQTDGTGPGWYFRNVNVFSAIQNYIVTIVNGPSYAGYDYAMDVGDCGKFYANVEVDYYPAAMHLSNIADNVIIEGIIFNNGAPIAANVPVVCLFDNTSVRNVDFSKFTPIMGALPNSNYFYSSTGGGSPTINGIQGLQLYFDTAVSPNVAFLNTTNLLPVPFRDIEFHGDTEDGLSSGPINFEVNGAGATQDQYQSVFVNGFPLKVPIPALANSATPSVKAGQGPFRKFLTGGTTTITNFTDGFEGLEIRILAEHAITITDGTNIFLNASGNFAMNGSDSLDLVNKADGKWYETGRSDNT